MRDCRGTKVYCCHNLEQREAREGLREGARILKEAGVVAFPTETVYGLGANGLDEEAVRSIFQVKGRPTDNPLILHLASTDNLNSLVREVPEQARLLMDEFWPGPLTIILRRRTRVPSVTTAGLDTVALRMPDHQVALALIQEAGLPLAAPSANLSGLPSPTRAQHVLDDFAGRIPLLLDGGETGIGLESTVIDLTRNPPLLLRPGGLTIEELEEKLGRVELADSLEMETPSSPGLKYRHYAPRAEMIVFEGKPELVREELLRRAEKAHQQKRMVGILSTSESFSLYFQEGFMVLKLGSMYRPREIAHNFFDLLRELDRLGVDLILAEGVESRGLGLAIMNRMRKSASHRVVRL